MLPTFTIAALFTLWALGCQPSAQSDRAGGSQPPPAPSAHAGPLAADGFSKNPSKATEQMRTQGLEMPQIAKLLNERPATDPVPWERLLKLMPKYADWTANGCGGTVTPVEQRRSTRASCTYLQEHVPESVRLRVVLEFVDTAFEAAAYAAYEGKRGVERQDQKGYIRAINIQGHPAYEEWKEKGKHIVIVVLVSDRFLVKMQGTNLSPPLAREWLNTLDLKELAALGG